MAGADSDEEYEIPLRGQRYFGSGLKRKRIHFVPSALTTVPVATDGLAAQQYLSIVLGSKVASGNDHICTTTSGPEETAADTIDALEATNDNASPETGEERYCELCKRPISATESTRQHDNSIAHQISLSHSHPPSHLDRARKGLAVLQDQGWDPDSRLGLGAQGEGRREPIKAKENPNRAGLGAKYLPAEKKARQEKLDAGKVRAMEEEKKKKAERLRNAFYMPDDVQKYLGEAGVELSGFDVGRSRKGRRLR
jgi:hypothetical protein